MIEIDDRYQQWNLQQKKSMWLYSSDSRSYIMLLDMVEGFLEGI